jgi:cell division septation protein DedD
MKQNLALLITDPVYIAQDKQMGELLHKVRIGPVSPARLDEIQHTLRQQKLPSGLILP